jgi:hypothetical protein
MKKHDVTISLTQLLLFIMTLISQRALAQSLPSADTLLSKWKDAMYTTREESIMTLTLIDGNSQETVKREAKVYYRSDNGENNRMMMRFTSPAAIRGTAFLSIREADQNRADQWLYFPAYKKARRLSARNPEEPFLDSDFNNGDISFDHEKTFHFTVKGIKKINGVDVYVVEGKLKNPGTYKGQYSKEILYIQKKEHLNIRTEFYGMNGELIKTLTVPKWVKYGSRWAADLIQVKNEKTKHRSIIEFKSRNLKADPSPRIFTMSELESNR